MLLKLERSTAVFEVYNPYSIVQLSEVLQDLTIRRGERVIYDGDAVVVNLVNTGLMLIVSTTLTDGWKDLNGLLEQKSEIRVEVDRFISDWTNAHALRPGYMLAITSIRGFLSELHRWLGQIDVSYDQAAEVPSPDLDADLYEQITTPLLPRLYELFSQFEHEASKISDEEVNVHKRYAQHDLHPLLMTAPFVHRTFTKPLGYAGDYEMVNMMTRNSREGSTTYAQLINSLHLNTGVAQAHRNRIKILKDYVRQLIGESAGRNAEICARILNVGCGPAKELQELIEQEPDLDRCGFNLVDFNVETLEQTDVILRDLARSHGRRLQLALTHGSVHELLKKALKRESESLADRYDLIYCAGLFDYLSDKVCARLLMLFYHWLNPGGTILITNVHPSNPNRYAMEHVLEWHLVYRSNADMAALCPHLGSQRVFRDETGVNVFLDIRKPGTPHA